jgi:ubiquinone biosynthesis protein UbiJ
MQVSCGTILEWSSGRVYRSVSSMYLEGDVVLGQELQTPTSLLSRLASDPLDERMIRVFGMPFPAMGSGLIVCY